MQTHQHEHPMKKCRKNFNVQLKWTNKLPETKMLPCETSFQKWHPITQPWEISKLP
jgi:FtsP/CotA-like multicopper oxidase with cupredoxin domain